MDSYKKRRNQLIIISVSAFVIFAVCIGLIFMPRQKNGPELGIEGLSKTVANLPAERRSAIQAMLLTTVRMNTSENIDESNISKGVIREGTEKSDFDQDKELYTGSFIVDLESIRQSYEVAYFYREDPDSFITGGNTVEVTCLPPEKLIYGDFDCKDILSEQSKDVDPIIKELPFISTYFKVSAHYVGDELELTAELRMLPSDYDKSPVAAVQKYKEKVYTWIRSTGNDPSSYTIKFNYADSGEKLS